MRFIYIDEAGTSAKEPVSVVVGVIVHADQQRKLLADRLQELVVKYVPEQHRAGFVFHTKDVFNGGGRVFNKDGYDPERRWNLLIDLLKLPRELRIPLSVGYFRRTQSRDGVSPAMSLKIDNTIPFQYCLATADRYVREYHPGEVSTVVAEDNNEMKRMWKMIHLEMCKPESKNFAGMSDYLPLMTIVDTVHFAGKHESPLLQMADVCAYTIRRYINGEPYGRRAYDALTGGLHHPNVQDFGKHPAQHALMAWQEVPQSFSYVNFSRSDDIVLASDMEDSSGRKII